MPDDRLRAAERAHAADPSAWRPLVAELRRAGRVEEARAAALRAWDVAKARFDVLCPPDEDLARPRPRSREEQAARLAAMDVCLVDMDEALALGRELLEELRRADDAGRCYCDAYPLPHTACSLFIRGRRRRARAS
jgi:hypothetical protein